LRQPVGVLWVCWAILVGILAVALVVPEAPLASIPMKRQAIAEILRQPRVRALMAACLAMSAAHGAFYVFYSIHLSAYGYSKTEVGGLWSLGVLAEISVFMLMARLCLRFSMRFILLASFAAAVIRFLLMGWGVESVTIMILVQLLHGLTFGAYHASAIAAVNEWFPGQGPGARTGLVLQSLVRCRRFDRRLDQRLHLGCLGGWLDLHAQCALCVDWLLLVWGWVGRMLRSTPFQGKKPLILCNNSTLYSPL
jgi:PPP family 3-phenylpropionic acid transporter